MLIDISSINKAFIIVVVIIIKALKGLQLGRGGGGGGIGREFTVLYSHKLQLVCYQSDNNVKGSNPHGRNGKLFLSSNHYGVKAYFSFLTRGLLSQ